MIGTRRESKIAWTLCMQMLRLLSSCADEELSVVSNLRSMFPTAQHVPQNAAHNGHGLLACSDAPVETINVAEEGGVCGGLWYERKCCPGGQQCFVESDLEFRCMRDNLSGNRPLAFQEVCACAAPAPRHALSEFPTGH